MIVNSFSDMILFMMSLVLICSYGIHQRWLTGPCKLYLLIRQRIKSMPIYSWKVFSVLLLFQNCIMALVLNQNRSIHIDASISKECIAIYSIAELMFEHNPI